MNQLFKLVLFILVISCSNDRLVVENYAIPITYFKDPKHRYKEKINVEKSISKDSVVFIYKYKNLKQENDTLIVAQKVIKLQNVNLEFVAKRIYRFVNKNLEVKKYIFDGANSSSEVYINDSIGILLWRNYKSDVEVQYDDRLNFIFNKINRDTTFFNVMF